MTAPAAAQAAGALTAHRPMLLGLAYRLLGSLHDAEDVLQEAYLRWLDVDRAAVTEPRRYLSRVVTLLHLLDRSAEDCRQLHHRAVALLADDRRRFTAGPAEQRRLLDAFLAAARDGDLARLTDLVAADAIAWTDGGGRVRAARRPVHGADRIARFFAGVHGPRRPGARATPIDLNGAPALLLTWPAGARYTLGIAATGDRITGLYLVGNPDNLTHVGG